MKKYLIVVLSLVLSACQQQVKQSKIETDKYSQFQKTEWLIGNWQKQTKKEILTESWQKLDDSTLVGQSYFIDGVDTLSSESIRIEQRNRKLFYIPTVKGQNNGMVVNFNLTSVNDSSLIFENPEHDFPQKITYNKMKNDSLMAEISAILNGNLKSQKFQMGRVK